MSELPAVLRPPGILEPTDFQNGRIRRLRLRGRWLLQPGSRHGRFADGVQYAIAIDDEAWIVVWRYGGDGGVIPTTRWYTDVEAARRDEVPEPALTAAGLLRSSA